MSQFCGKGSRTMDTSRRRSLRSRRSGSDSSGDPSPPVRASLLSDNTAIDIPRRKSWWKNIDHNSVDINEVFGNQDGGHDNLNIENIINVEVGPRSISAPKPNINLDDLSSTSENESIGSIHIQRRKIFSQQQTQAQNEKQQHREPQIKVSETKRRRSDHMSDSSVNESLGSIQTLQRKLFNHKQTQRNTKFQVSRRESLRSKNASVNDKTLTPSKEVKLTKLNQSKQSKEHDNMVPTSVANNTNIAIASSVANNTRGNITNVASKTIDGSIPMITENKPLLAKRKTVNTPFPVSLMAESDEESIHIQEKLVALKKNVLITKSSRTSISSRSSKRALSPGSNYSETMDLESWKLLPSSTMVGDEMLVNTPAKKLCRQLAANDEEIEDLQMRGEIHKNIKYRLENTSKVVEQIEDPLKMVELRQAGTNVTDIDIDNGEGSRNTTNRYHLDNEEEIEVRYQSKIEEEIQQFQDREKITNNNMENTNEACVNENKEKQQSNNKEYKVQECEKGDNEHDKLPNNENENQDVSNVSKEKLEDLQSILVDEEDTLVQHQSEDENETGEIQQSEDEEKEDEEILDEVDNMHQSDDIQTEDEEQEGEESEDNEEEIHEAQQSIVQSGNKDNKEQDDLNSNNEKEEMEKLQLSDDEITQEKHTDNDDKNEEENNMQNKSDNNLEEDIAQIEQNDNEIDIEEVQSNSEKESRNEGIVDQWNHLESSQKERAKYHDSEKEKGKLQQFDEGKVMEDEQHSENVEKVDDHHQSDVEMEEAQMSHIEKEDESIENEESENEEDDIEEDKIDSQESDNNEQDNDSNDFVDEDQDNEDSKSEEERQNSDTEENEESDHEEEISAMEEKEMSSPDNEDINNSIIADTEHSESKIAESYNHSHTKESTRYNSKVLDASEQSNRVSDVNNTPKRKGIEKINEAHSYDNNYSDREPRSSSEGSEWNSHTTMYQTRKSLRTLVLNKAAKTKPSKPMDTSADIDHDFIRPSVPARVTFANNSPDNTRSPLNNTTNSPVNSTANSSIDTPRTSQTKLDQFVQRIARENKQCREKMQEKIKSSIRKPNSNPNFEGFYFETVSNDNKNKKRAKENTKKTADNFKVVLDGAVYKPPKLYKPPKATWITVNLYKYLNEKLEARYGNETRVRSENFVLLLNQIFKHCTKRTTDVRPAVRALQRKMALMGLVDTYHEFYAFIRDFMPKEFRVKTIPDIVNGLPMEEDMFAVIIAPRVQ